MEHETQSTPHTPGPWLLGNLLDETAALSLGVWPEGLVPGQIGNPICLISSWEKLTPTDWANARLIAAAPQLLEACKLVIQEGISYRTFYEACEAAIAKATPHT